MTLSDAESGGGTSGKKTKFTPENIRQIINLVERGKNADEIAQVIGVTPGTLKATCSRLSISLRRPQFDVGTGLLRQRRKHSPRHTTPTNNSDKKRMSNEDNQPVFAIVMKYRGQERTIELPLGQEAVGRLAIEAEFRGLRIGELVARMVDAITKNDQFSVLLEPRNSERAD